MGFYSRRIFPRVLDFAMRGEEFRGVREEVLANARGKTLEIGFGTGLNLRYYPPTVSDLTVIDPNVGMNRLAQKRIAQSRLSVHHHVLRGEELPFEDDSFDTVVSTWTLCSIPDVDQALREMRRVLKPGGQFLYAEHGLADDPKLQRWQHRLTPLQKRIGDGCHLDRNIRALVQRAGFALTADRSYYLPKLPRIAGYTYQGVAAKSA